MNWDRQTPDDVLIEESLLLDAWFGLPITVRIINGEKWATLGERTGQ